MQINKGKRQGTTQSRVARGAKYLDKHFPGWWEEIDPSILDLSNGCKCVLGQLYNRERGYTHEVIGSGNASNGYMYLVSPTSAHKEKRLLELKARGLTRLTNIVMPSITARRLGFHVTNFNNGGDDWRELTSEWQTVIEERRTNALLGG